MSRQKLINNILPSYSVGEEIFNTVSHIIGVLLGVLSLILTIIFHHHIYGLISGLVFSFSLIFLYSMSSLYHGIPSKKTTAKKIFQIIDHCSIFILIAASCTPFALSIMQKYNQNLGLIFCLITWGITILGVTLNIINLKKYKIFSLICYLLMGWIIVARVDIVFQYIGINGLILLIAGGVAYTLGFVFYILGKRNKKWFHSVFHVLCIVGSILHCICIIKYLI